MNTNENDGITHQLDQWECLSFLISSLLISFNPSIHFKYIQIWMNKWIFYIDRTLYYLI